MRTSPHTLLPTSVALSSTARGHAAHEREDAREPLAHALGGLAPEDLREAHVGVREAHREVVAARERAAHPEVRLAEVDLALAGEPVQLQEALGVPLVRLAGHLPAAPPHVPLHSRVRPVVALLVPQTHVHAHGRVALPPPVPGVVGEPPVDGAGIGREQLALAPRPSGRLRRQVLHVPVLAHRGLGHAGGSRDVSHRDASPPHPPDVLDLVHADHPLLASSCRKRTHRQR